MWPLFVCMCVCFACLNGHIQLSRENESNRVLSPQPSRWIKSLNVCAIYAHAYTYLTHTQFALPCLCSVCVRVRMSLHPADPSVNPLTSWSLSGVFRGGSFSSLPPFTLLTALPPSSSHFRPTLISPLLLIFPPFALGLAVCQLHLPCHRCSRCCRHPFFLLFFSFLFLLQLQFRETQHGMLGEPQKEAICRH